MTKRHRKTEVFAVPPIDSRKESFPFMYLFFRDRDGIILYPNYCIIMEHLVNYESVIPRRLTFFQIILNQSKQ